MSVARVSEESRGRNPWLGLAVLVYWAAMFTGTHVPGPQVPAMPGHSDKLVHLLAYAGLAGLLGAWMCARGSSGVKLYLSALVMCVSYAVIDELLQRFIRNRTPDFADAVADAAGTVLGLSVLAVARRVARSLPSARPLAIGSDDR